MTLPPLPRNLVADLLAEEPNASRFVADLERAAGFPFVDDLGTFLRPVSHQLRRGAEIEALGNPSYSIAAYLIRECDEQFVSDLMAALEQRQAEIFAVADRLSASRLTFDADFWAPSDDEHPWLVEPLLVRGRGHLLYAPAKAGKSLFALYVAASLAAGRAVLGRPAGPPTPVLYIDSEMTEEDVRTRLRAMGFGQGDDLSLFDYHSLPDLPPLDTPRGGTDVLSLALLREAALVVIDTIGKMLGGDENANDTAQNFAIHTATALKRAGIALWRIDHSGKNGDRGARGASAKNDDPDVVWSLTAGEGRLTLTNTHSRIPWAPDRLALRSERNPIRYTPENSADDRPTAAAAATLDRLGVPPTYGKDRARPVLTAAGVSMSNERLLAAQTFRRTRAAEQGGHE
ncbi:AAA family ATPase [Aquihabitans sp. McL0605]|uniref:AAA family ATPase n=1 Tax=Aquihabitans sp. McL0605 TaxID=3415671 RepID=UPI003CEECEBC